MNLLYEILLKLIRYEKFRYYLAEIIGKKL